jgi:alcohol dehydrogenase
MKEKPTPELIRATIMKAVQMYNYGDQSVVELVEISKPQVGVGQVLVEVQAASLNPSDTSMRSGGFQDMIPLDFPVTLGGDITGIVVAVGEGVEGFLVGDKVFGQASALLGDSGGWAEFAVTHSDHLSIMPKTLNFQEAASLPLVGVSAVQALLEQITLQKDQKILITGGSGGIGTLAIQIAKSIGAYVATTATGDGIRLTRELGADEVFDYKTEDAASLLTQYDAVFDTIGGEGFDKSLTILKKGGIAVSMIAPANDKLATSLGITAQMQVSLITRSRLAVLAQLVESGAVKVQIGKIFDMENIREAFAARESGTVNGKVVLRINALAC